MLRYAVKCCFANICKRIALYLQATRCRYIYLVRCYWLLNLALYTTLTYRSYNLFYVTISKVYVLLYVILTDHLHIYSHDANKLWKCPSSRPHLGTASMMLRGQRERGREVSPRRCRLCTRPLSGVGCWFDGGRDGHRVLL